MAVTHTLLTDASDETNGTSYSTASISPSTDKLLILDVAADAASSGANGQPTVTGCGVTWVVVQSLVGVGSDGPNWARQTMFRAMGTPTTGALTIDFGTDTQEGVRWSLCEKGNVDTGGTNGSAAVVQSATGTSTTTSITVTLAAFGSTNNATHGAFHREGEVSLATQTPGTGFTEQTDLESDLTGGFYGYLHTIYRNDNDTTVDSSSSDAMDGTTGIAIEIKEAATAPTGTVDVTEADDTSTASIDLENTGTTDTTEANDTTTTTGILENTGTTDYTEEADTSTASGTQGNVGTTDTTDEDDTSTASGIYEYIGTTDTTDEDDISTASGSYEYIGTTDTTEEDDISIVNGIYEYIGTTDTTDEDDTSIISGSILVSGTTDTTEEDDTITANGSILVTGTTDTTDEDDTATANGTVGDVVNGTLVHTDEDDTTTTSGTVQAQVSGTLVETEEDDISTASGIYEYIGTTDTTEEDDTSTASGIYEYIGTVVQTEEDDTSTASGIQGTIITGILVETNDNDTIIANGTVQLIITGTTDYIEEDDTSTASGTVQAQVLGTLDLTDDNDTTTTAGNIYLEGTIDESLDNDTSTINLEITVLGTTDTTEEDDTLSNIGGVYHTGTSSTTEDDDTITSSGITTLLAILNLVDEDDTVEAAGLNGDGTFVWGDITEGDDTLTATGIAPPEFTTLVSDITTIIDKSEETNVVNYNIVTNITDNTADILVDKDPVTYILSECIQGPAGPPTGYNTSSEALFFIGSGFGASKTVTGINENVIYEGFGIGDELYMMWIIPVDINRNVNPKFEGTFFTTIDNSGGYDTSWEIHITVHNQDHTYDFTNIIYANDLPLLTTAFVDTHAFVEVDKALFLINDTYTMHIKLKRVNSTNDPSPVTTIGVSDIHMDFGTEGRVGIQGPDGTPEDEIMYAKRVDFIDDNLLYKAEAVPGTLDSAGIWRIRRITISAVDSDVNETWADGDDNFDNVWDNRLTYTYS